MRRCFSSSYTGEKIERGFGFLKRKKKEIIRNEPMLSSGKLTLHLKKEILKSSKTENDETDDMGIK
jgi:hypothetical protein